MLSVNLVKIWFIVWTLELKSCEKDYFERAHS